MKLHQLRCYFCKKLTGEEGTRGDFTACHSCRATQTAEKGRDWIADVIIRDIDAPDRVAQPWRPGLYDDDQ